MKIICDHGYENQPFCTGRGSPTKFGILGRGNYCFPCTLNLVKGHSRSP